MITTKRFWRATAVRAMHTVAQSFLSLIPATGLTLGSVNWTITLSASIGAGIVSVVKSIAAVPPEVE